MQTVKDLAGEIARNVPILTWLSNHDRLSLTVDVGAGLTLWGLIVPEATVDVDVAGLPTQAAL